MCTVSHGSQRERRSAFHEVVVRLETALTAIVHGEFAAFPERCAGILPIAAKSVKAEIELQQFGAIVAEVARHALERVETRFFWRHAVAHVFDDGVGAGHADVFFSTAGGSGGADVLVQVETRADNGRIADAARNLPRQAAGGSDAGHLA